MMKADVQKLVNIALGKEKADLMLCGAKLVNVFTAEIETVDVSVVDGYIARVAPVQERNGHEAYETIDATGKYLIPGLIDAHTHIEMSFMTVTPFAEAVLPHGTTAAIIDTHDIGNVSADCLLWLGRELDATPLKGHITVPPCVPSSPGLEDAGMTMDLENLKYCSNVPNFIALGETMDFNRVISAEPEMMRMLGWAKEHGCFVDGHCPQIVGDALQAYVAAGPSTDHEFVTVEEALEKYRLGMKVVVRRGSLEEPYNAKELVDQIKDTRNLLLATDGCITLDTIVKRGTVINALRTIVAEGVDPVLAVQMATINVARAYGLEKRIGAIAPGLCADMILVEDLKDFKIEAVYVDGKRIPKPGAYHLPRFAFPDNVLHTISLEPVEASCFAIKAPVQSGDITVHVLDAKEDVLISGDCICDVPVANGEIHAIPERDILKISVLHRYQPKGTHTTALVRGFGFRSGALAGSIGQDSQNIVVVGTNDEDMAVAVNEVIRLGGGVVFAADHTVRGTIALPMGGIMNPTAHPDELLEEFGRFNALTKQHVGSFDNPAFPLSLMLTCACIPELKITNRALVDALSGRPVSLFAEDETVDNK